MFYFSSLEITLITKFLPITMLKWNTITVQLTSLTFFCTILTYYNHSGLHLKFIRLPNKNEAQTWVYISSPKPSQLKYFLQVQGINYKIWEILKEKLKVFSHTLGYIRGLEIKSRAESWWGHRGQNPREICKLCL